MKKYIHTFINPIEYQKAAALANKGRKDIAAHLGIAPTYLSHIAQARAPINKPELREALASFISADPQRLFFLKTAADISAERADESAIIAGWLKRLL